MQLEGKTRHAKKKEFTLTMAIGYWPQLADVRCHSADTSKVADTAGINVEAMTLIECGALSGIVWLLWQRWHTGGQIH